MKLYFFPLLLFFWSYHLISEDYIMEGFFKMNVTGNIILDNNSRQILLKNKGYFHNFD